MSKKKKLSTGKTKPLIGEKSSLESIDLVNFFVCLEKNLKEKKNYTLTFDEMFQNIKHLKTVGSLESFLIKKFENEKK